MNGYVKSAFRFSVILLKQSDQREAYSEGIKKIPGSAGKSEWLSSGVCFNNALEWYRE